MAPKPSISVIIPAINEERTIRGVVETVRTWGKGSEVIAVIDEATTDGTESAVRSCGDGIKILKNARDKGKGEAMAAGIAQARGDILLFVDADLVSLTPSDLDLLVAPLIKGTYSMAIGVLRYWQAGGYEPFNDISGTRSVRRDRISGHIEKMHNKGYGIEVFFNNLIGPKEITHVRLPHVFVLTKFEKQTATDAIITYIIEARDLLTEAINVTSSVSPRTRKMLRGVKSYLKTALEYFSVNGRHKE
ncbi:hypothetical protein A2Z33_00135 [Candidatus Gottesmanbacteria bacterium RBG_16_52_11]|uniref:Glycosyltransferase 2-like domain-containing protein n=1 Tax=Candidatus Gottesmanbacteria bacterium RBG_16_52_11 TaxID=1798374 RepID=A0A1F5YN05_9BACT|nr:MAG: hypothetical protein A2Z33_00135 [Candidatus Gottesmanbacteria bacterium RBG_16_52_11]